MYRPFRVGNVLTDANACLKPERARGFEAGAREASAASTGRVVAFWSRVDDAIVNVTVSASGAAIVRERQNAARIRAAGVELEAGCPAVTAPLSLTASTAFTDSIFTDGPLPGLRVPQVARAHHAAGARAMVGDVRVSADWRFIGRQFDDDRNVFLLDQSSMLDARVGWMDQTRTSRCLRAMENLLDEEQDVGRTPLRTLGLPRMARMGLRIQW